MNKLLTLLKEVEERFDEKFGCNHHAAQCDGHCQDKYKSFLAQELERQKEEILKIVEEWSNTCGDGCEGGLINKIKLL